MARLGRQRRERARITRTQPTPTPTPLVRNRLVYRPVARPAFWARLGRARRRKPVTVRAPLPGPTLRKRPAPLVTVRQRAPVVARRRHRQAIIRRARVAAAGPTVYSDAGNGTLTLSGSGSESAVHTSAATGTLTLTGTGTETFVPSAGGPPDSPGFTVHHVSHL